MLTFKAMPNPNGPPTWRVLAGAAFLGTISNPGPSAGPHSWHGVAPDGTRFSSTSRPRLAEQLQAHARKDLRR